MKKILTCILFLQVFILSHSQQPEANYDESKIPAYTLPDPLIFNDGSRVSTKEDWNRRRSELSEIFRNEVYGISPEWKGKLTSSEISSDPHALNDKAIRKEVKITSAK